MNGRSSNLVRRGSLRALLLAAVVLAISLPAVQAGAITCTETSIFTYTTQPSGVTYPVNGEQGQLNTTWLHYFDGTCTNLTPVTAETVGLQTIWASHPDYLELGDKKFPGYTGYGSTFEEYQIYPGNVTQDFIGPNPITSSYMAFLIRKSGTANNFTAEYDTTGTEGHYVIAKTYCCFAADRGEGWSESSKYGPATGAQSSQDLIQWRCPCDGLWRYRAAHITCYDSMADNDLASVSFYYQMKVLKTSSNTNICRP